MTNRHLLVTPDGEQRGLVDEALASEGLTRRVVATVPLFLPALVSLAVSDLVACLPSRIVALFAEQFDLQHQALAFDAVLSGLGGVSQAQCQQPDA